MGAWQEPPPITPMGLFYPNVTPVIWIGTKSGTTLTAHALTNAYSGSTATKYVSGFSVMTIDVAYTVGAAETNNTCDIQLEHSVDGTNFYILTNEAASAGTSTFVSLSSREHLLERIPLVIVWTFHTNTLDFLPSKVEFLLMQVRYSLKAFWRVTNLYGQVCKGQ